MLLTNKLFFLQISIQYSQTTGGIVHPWPLHGWCELETPWRHHHRKRAQETLLGYAHHFGYRSDKEHQETITEQWKLWTFRGLRVSRIQIPSKDGQVLHLLSHAGHQGSQAIALDFARSRATLLHYLRNHWVVLIPRESSRLYCKHYYIEKVRLSTCTCIVPPGTQLAIFIRFDLKCLHIVV